MAKAKEFWYVLVMTNEGPKFVTDTKGNTAYWNEDGYPKPFNKSYAREMAVGLIWNGYVAYPVSVDYELLEQPYNYEDYEIKFVKKGADNNDIH